MGWLFGKKDDGLYRGDPPVSTAVLGQAPDRLNPAYQGNPQSPAQPFTVRAAQQSTAAAAQAAAFGAVQAPPVAPGQPPTHAIPPEVAAAMAYAQNQQRFVTRTITRSMVGFLLPLLLVGGLVVAGFVVVGGLGDEIGDRFSSGRSGPGRPFEGVVGAPGDVALGDNDYRITIEAATAQPSAAWGSSFTPASGAFLVIQLSLTRTDRNADVDQISWFDWEFVPESGELVEGALIAGGYEPLLSTLILQPDDTATGLVAFDTTASVGTLRLTNFDGTWAQWPITAATPAVVAGELATGVRPEVGQTPFSVTVANPRWISTGEPAVRIVPASGSYLVLDVTVTADEGVLAAGSGFSFGYANWQFTPAGGTSVPSGFGVVGTEILAFSPGQPSTSSTLVGFDAPRGAGTVDLLNSDGSVLATWQIPAP
ncbi:MAG: hypothetical protein M3492_02975 [Actinomycetota bacterium]|nr:hypothetical protein [Actinomycetota bacterium]